jgi:hypothetical protein
MEGVCPGYVLLAGEGVAARKIRRAAVAGRSVRLSPGEKGHGTTSPNSVFLLMMLTMS